MSYIPDRVRGETGASLISYAALIALIAVIAIPAFSGFGDNSNEYMCAVYGGFEIGLGEVDDSKLYSWDKESGTCAKESQAPPCVFACGG